MDRQECSSPWKRLFFAPNIIQCSCLENPRDGGAWWGAVYGVTQSRTQLKWLSSSSSRYADDTTLTAESEEELRSLLMKVKEESEKVGLKLNIQKTKIMASGPITSWQIDGETVETVADFIFLDSKITADGDCSHEIKRRLLLGRKAMTNLSSIQSLSCFWLFVTHGLQHSKIPCPSPTPGAYSNSCPSKSMMPSNHLFLCWSPSSPAFFLSQHQSFPVSQFFTSGGQSIGVSASTTVLPMNIQDWFPLELTGLISLQSSPTRVFSNTTVQKHQFFSAQLSLWSNFHI